VTIYRTLLSSGYFPKELPPAFFTAQFAGYAASGKGRKTLKAYKPADNFTACVSYDLALPGGGRRPLRIAHPHSFSILCSLVSQHFRRLLTRANSTISRSRPVYSTDNERAIRPAFSPASRPRERLLCRGGSTWLLRLDVSQYYPSLYTHAVGWAIDSKLRQRKHWRNGKLLGKKLDQALMDLQGKVSQGIPIGNDISFLLGEAVLAQVDRDSDLPRDRSYRWFDDFEIACSSRDEAESFLGKITRALDRYQLRINPSKTKIIELPAIAREEWQQDLRDQASHRIFSMTDVVALFDRAFTLRTKFPEAAVIAYALGVLFSLKRPKDDVAKVAQSAISQSILAEPGSAQKAYALLTYWALNGMALNEDLLRSTIEEVILRHRMRGASSDVSWALSFCLTHGIKIGKKAAAALSDFDDDCSTLQALHMNSIGLIPNGFKKKAVAKLVEGCHPDGEHWLLAYESLRHGFLPVKAAPLISSNPLFMDLLKKRVTFYRIALPKYAPLLHSGGMPPWLKRMWLSPFSRGPDVNGSLEQQAKNESEGALAQTIHDAATVARVGLTLDELTVRLLGLNEAESFASLVTEGADMGDDYL
jgi:hypothetical protein